MLSSITQEQINKVFKLKEEKDLSFEKIGEVLGFSERTARRRYEAAILAKQAEHLTDDETKLTALPKLPKLNLGNISKYIPDNQSSIERLKPLKRTGNAAVVCDFHIPLHDSALVNVLINAARAHDIKTLIIAGDYFNMDELSSYLPHQPEAAFDIERYEGNLIMKTLLKTFDEVDFIWGNHDFRLTRKLGFKESFSECMKWTLSELTDKEFSKIRFSDLDYMDYYPVKSKHFRICHPRNFSSAPLTVGRKLAQKYNCSVITAHSHHCAIGASPNGRDIVIEGGGFFNKARTEYIQKTSTHHEWTQGFTLFVDGIPNIISPTIGNDKFYR